MSEWIYCHKCYAPAGGKVSLPETGQEVVLSYIDRNGRRFVGVGEYVEEAILITKSDSDIMPDEGMMFHTRSFTIFGEDDAAAVPYDEQHMYYEKHGRHRCYKFIGYAWKPIDVYAETNLLGFPTY